uniref:Uncharacterized protein n=1 Tax=Amphilophus citrinellus TaxID=61819 RepID=A0A3Q0SSX7_AMPCI
MEELRKKATCTSRLTNLRNAIQCFTEAITHRNRAAAYKQQRKWTDMVQDCNKAVELSPDYAMALLWFSWCSVPGCPLNTSKFDNEVVIVGWPPIMGVEAVHEGGQHTVLWGASAQCAGGGEIGAKSCSLGPVG